MEPYFLLLAFTIGIIIIQENTSGLRLALGGMTVDLTPWLVYIVYLAFFALREGIGYDYPMYQSFVEGDVTIGYYGRGELLSAYLIDCAYEYGDYHLFFFSVALIALAGIVYALHCYVDYRASLGWGMLVFLAIPMGFTELLSVQRQFLAVGIVLFAFRYIMQGSFIRYLLLICIAFTAHTSSLIALPFYLLRRPGIGLPHMLVLLAAGMAATLAAQSLLMSLVPMYAMYMENIGIAESGGYTQLLLYVAIWAVALLIYRYVRDSSSYRIMLKIFSLGMIVTLILTPFGAKIAIRFGAYGIFFFMLMLPLFFRAFRGSNRAFIKILAVAVLTGLYVYSLAVTPPGIYIPYRTFL